MDVDDCFVLKEQGPRADFLQWDDYFMAIAQLSAMRSKDPNTQVGACIVDSTNRIVAVGYNGLPIRISDLDMPWARESSGGPLYTKYPYVVHAEANAILNKNSAGLGGCRIYTILYPCCECAKLIIQSGIKEVIYLSNKYAGEWSFEAARILFEKSGVVVRQMCEPGTITLFSEEL